MTTLAFSRDLRDFGAAGFFFGGCFIPPGVFETRLGKARGEGRQKSNNDNPTYICASSPKQVRAYVLVLLFLGKGSSKTRGTQLSAFPKSSRGKYFFGGGVVWVDFFSLFFFRFFIALVKRLSVRGTQKRDQKQITQPHV
jgi:hypothetical protein